jgi:putative transposase
MTGAICVSQGRYYSCPLDQSHLWEALRYTELNPVRAGLVLEAELWPWSSAACHCGAKEQDESLTMEPWRSHWTRATWREYLSAGETEAKLAIIRQRTHTLLPEKNDRLIHPQPSGLCRSDTLHCGRRGHLLP